MGKHRSESFWRDHLVRFESSGLSRSAYCRQHRIATHSLDYWRRRLAVGTSRALVPVVVAEPGVVSGLELQVGEARLSMPASIDPAWLGRLLRAAGC
jgi:transposase-like protein